MADSPEYYQRGRSKFGILFEINGLSYHLGNAVKYICRAGHKDDYIQDLEKAIHYLENELQHATCGGVPTQVRSPYSTANNALHRRL